MESLIVKGRMAVRNRVIDFGPSKQKDLTIPNQSLSLRTILDRFSRGVPVDVRQREAVYIDQYDYDLEALGRAEFSTKMSIAEELRAKYDAQVAALERRREAKQKEEQESRIRAELSEKSSEKAEKSAEA